jgi:hypothetical protein
MSLVLSDFLIKKNSSLSFLMGVFKDSRETFIYLFKFLEMLFFLLLSNLGLSIYYFLRNDSYNHFSQQPHNKLTWLVIFYYQLVVWLL